MASDMFPPKKPEALQEESPELTCVGSVWPHGVLYCVVTQLGHSPSMLADAGRCWQMLLDFSGSRALSQINSHSL